MNNDQLIERIQEYGLPSIADVTKKSRPSRSLKMHFFDDDGEFYASGFDLESRRGPVLFGYNIHWGPKLSVSGAWKRVTVDYLATKTSEAGANYVLNENFQSCRAKDLQKYRVCEEFWDTLQ